MPKGMFAIPRKTLADGLHRLQRTQCVYDRYPDGPQPEICDCKYGFIKQVKDIYTGERNGCPELRLATMLFLVMTEAEYEELLKRADCVI